jgi:TorA maturation chaperone TorD
MNIMKQERLQENEAAQRGILYALLSRTFIKEPDLELIRYFKSVEVQAILKELDLSLGELFLKTDEETLVQELAVEFSRLFLTPPTHLPPFESIYAGGQNQPEETFGPALQGKAAEEVLTFYHEHGILFPEEIHLLPDHIAIELEALRLLSELESEAVSSSRPDRVSQYRRITGTFIAEHPNRWVPTFCDRILQNTSNPYFRVVAQLTRSFIESEFENLAPCCDKKEEVTQ